MLRQKLYYAVKPLIPRDVRVEVRGWFTRRKRERVREVWPILHGSERPPEGWPGWPDGKKFALVLTHDVERQGGVDKCRKLMELEASRGFRSSFNFIPEGEYRVSKELRDELTGNGFEVGVHDLHHDGKLYSSRQGFAEKAKKINRYLKEWGAVGFRSGFMLHNLDWLGDLEVAYEASTFDVDPFEPQPDGAGTIFPFWVTKRGRSTKGDRQRGIDEVLERDEGGSTKEDRQSFGERAGYLELPYTLPQDSTVFLLLKEKHPDIWFQKLDWIAKHGGMALLNVHPDYLCFDGETPSEQTFPAECYARFLDYAKQRYGDSVWHVLPRELAAYVAPFKPIMPTKPKRVCMVTHSHYLSDSRVMRYAKDLAARGDSVDVLALRRTPEEPKHEVFQNLMLTRLQPRRREKEGSPVSYLWPTVKFLLTSLFTIAARHREKPYDLLHIHNIPDFLVLAAAYPRLRGAKVILDVHDIVPEFYASKFGIKESALIIRMLKGMEWISARMADHVILASHLWVEKYAQRTGSEGKCSVFINNVDAEVFFPRERTRNDSKFIIIFPGGLQWHQGLDIAIRAFREVLAKLPEAEFHIYGDGNVKQELVALARDLGVEKKVKFFSTLPVSEVAVAMANADLGVVPKRANSFGNEAYSTKIMEFMSLGVPVVISSTKVDRYYFDDSVVRFFESGNEKELAAAILELARDPERRKQQAARATAYVQRHSWQRRKTAYLGLVDALVSGDSASVPADPLDRTQRVAPRDRNCEAAGELVAK